MDRPCPSCGAPLPPGLRETFCAVCTLQGALALGKGEMPVSELTRSIGDYELLAEVGRGGMGAVFRTRQRSLGREAAVKLLLAGHFADATSRQRFRAEAEAAARLRHPGIVEVFEVGEYDGQPFLAMEFLEGGTLAERLHDGPIPSRDAATLVTKIARAVDYAHSRGVLHRDLKTSNVLLDAFGEPRVTDFGLAKQIDGGTALTLSGQVLGSPSFMAPEQARGPTSAMTAAADIYSLGAILYHLTTARPPFQGESMTDVLHQLEHHEPVSPRRLNPGIPPDLERIIQQCLEKSPSRRYRSAKALSEDLDRFLSGLPVRARPLAPWAHAARWCRREPGLAISLLLLVILTAGSLTTAVRLSRAERAARLHLERAEQNAYAGDLALADRAIEDGDLARTRELLERHQPPPRGPDPRTFEWRLLWTLSSDQSAAVLHGHQHIVSSVVFLPDGRLASGSWDGTIRFWSLPDRTEKQILQEYDGRIWSLDVSRDGRHFLASGENGVVVWETATWRARARLPGNFGYGSACFLPDGNRVAAGSRQGAAVWDIISGIRVADLPGAASPLAVSPDGAWLAARRGRALTLFDTRQWQPVRQFTTGTMASFGLRDLAFSRSGDQLLVGDGRGWLGVVNPHGTPTNLLSIQESRLRPQPHRGWVSQIVLSPDGRHYATVGADHGVLLWRTTDHRLQARFRGHHHEVWSAAYSPDGRWLATSGKDETIRLWDLSQPRPNDTRVMSVTQKVLGVWSPDEVLLAPHPEEAQDRLQVLNWRSKTTNRTLPIPNLPTAADTCFQSASRQFAFRATNGMVEVWDLLPEPPVRHLAVQASPAPHAPVVLSADGHLLAVYRPEDHGATLWDTRRGDLLSTLQESGPVVEINAEHAISQPTPETPRVFNARTGAPLCYLTGHKEPVSRVLLLPDSQSAVTTSYDGTLRFWDLPGGRLLATGRSQRQGIYALALSPDGQTLAAAGQEGVTQFWNVATRQQTIRWVQRLVVSDLWFAPEGNALLLLTGRQLKVVAAESPVGP